MSTIKVVKTKIEGLFIGNFTDNSYLDFIEDAKCISTYAINIGLQDFLLKFLIKKTSIIILINQDAFIVLSPQLEENGLLTLSSLLVSTIETEYNLTIKDTQRIEIYSNITKCYTETLTSLSSKNG